MRTKVERDAAYEEITNLSGHDTNWRRDAEISLLRDDLADAEREIERTAKQSRYWAAIITCLDAEVYEAARLEAKKRYPEVQPC